MPSQGFFVGNWDLIQHLIQVYITIRVLYRVFHGGGGNCSDMHNQIRGSGGGSGKIEISFMAYETASGGF